MDIDNKDVNTIININKIEKILFKFIRRTFNHDLECMFIRKSDDSNSYHVYGNFATTLQMMKNIVENVDESIDLQVYKKETSIRMCNTYKYDNKTKSLTKTFYNAGNSFNATIINNITGLKIIKQNIGL